MKILQETKDFKILIPLFILIVIVVPVQTVGIEEIKGNQFLLENFKLFYEIGLIQDKWIEIENILDEMDPIDMEFDWKKMNDKANNLFEEIHEMYKHFGSDLKKVEKKLNEKELEKLMPFLRQALIYEDVVMRAIMKITEIINRLYKMSLDPESWTAKEYFEQVDKYKKLEKEYKEEGMKMNDEFEKTKKLVIYS